MRRLLVRLLAAVLVCEGVVLSLLAAAFFILERVPTTRESWDRGGPLTFQVMLGATERPAPSA
jgi:hypothetical protein